MEMLSSSGCDKYELCLDIQFENIGSCLGFDILYMLLYMTG